MSPVATGPVTTGPVTTRPVTTRSVTTRSVAAGSHPRECPDDYRHDNLPLPRPVTRDEARALFLSTAPNYQGVAGLVRKVYVLSQDGGTAGGIYLWNSRADADALYSESWKAFVREKYGTEPLLAYFDSPVVVDNLTNEIVSDA